MSESQHHSRSGTQFTFEHPGRRFIAGCRVEEIDRGLVWIVGAAAPESDCTGVLARNRVATLIIAIVALSLAVPLTLVLARQRASASHRSFALVF